MRLPADHTFDIGTIAGFWGEPRRTRITFRFGLQVTLRATRSTPTLESVVLHPRAHYYYGMYINMFILIIPWTVYCSVKRLKLCSSF